MRLCSSTRTTPMISRGRLRRSSMTRTCGPNSLGVAANKPPSFRSSAIVNGSRRFTPHCAELPRPGSPRIEVNAHQFPSCPRRARLALRADGD